MTDISDYNRKAWDMEVEKGSVWTRPVEPAVIEEARKGNWKVVLTPTKPVPQDWFPPLANKKILCLACGGGQQGPIFAACGANVTVFDNSPRQLEQDRLVAKRENLNLELELGDMRDLSRFPDEYFDLVFNPASIIFVDDGLCVWREAFRVLKKGGSFLAGHSNPIQFIFDLKAWNSGDLIIRHKIPYSDLVDLSEDERDELILDKNEPLCFGHSLYDLIQGQIEAGFLIAGFYEDNSGGREPLDKYIDIFFATKAVKL
jgi:SAM-dependent methyltransferase